MLKSVIQMHYFFYSSIFFFYPTTLSISLSLSLSLTHTHTHTHTDTQNIHIHHCYLPLYPVYLTASPLHFILTLFASSKYEFVLQFTLKMWLLRCNLHFRLEGYVAICILDVIIVLQFAHYMWLLCCNLHIIWLLRCNLHICCMLEFQFGL